VSTLVYLAVPFFIGLMLLEAFGLARRNRDLRGYTWPDTAASLGMGLGNVAISVVTKIGVLAIYAALYQWAIFDLRGQWWIWPLAFLGDDFAYYWFHRASHEVRFLWAAHENHHSSTHYNLSTALRQSWTTPLTAPLFWAPLAILGIPPEMIFLAQGVSLVYQFWIHTELIDRLGPLEWILNTPSHHRVHHGRNIEYLDRNHGGILIVWDRLFGTFEPERAHVEYGLTKQIHTYNPLRIAFHEWAAMLRDARRAGSWSAAVKVFLMPPGWSADGSSMTASQLRRELAGARVAVSSAPGVEIGSLRS
jgi:sterol desaturase/sphingolipid hydroxylase (fatty acid hydroxylase superfamily)